MATVNPFRTQCTRDARKFGGGALEHDALSCIRLGNLLLDMQQHAGNEARDEEIADRGLNKEQADLCMQLAELYRTNRRLNQRREKVRYNCLPGCYETNLWDDVGHTHAIRLCKNSIIYKNLCLALGEIVLGVE